MNEREYLAKAYALKAVSAAFEVLARPLWNRNSPEVGREVLNVAYDTANRRKQSLDVFVPKSEPPYPVLTYIHGSAWHLLATADAQAATVLAAAYPGREIVPVPCRPLIWQNGSLHCITMQLPEGLI